MGTGEELTFGEGEVFGDGEGETDGEGEDETSFACFCCSSTFWL